MHSMNNSADNQSNNLDRENSQSWTNEIVQDKEQKIIQGIDVTQSYADVLLAKYEYLQITDATNIPIPKPLIKINNEIIATAGNIITISGAPKAAKTAFASVVMAGAIANGEYDGFDGIEIAPSAGKAVIHFDTEQARYHHQKNLKSTLQRAGIQECPDNFRSYNIKKEDINIYKTITSEILAAAAKKFGGVHVVVIDGGADYLYDVNDAASSNELVKYYEYLAVEYNTVVLVIVHVNPNSNKERGHFGSQLQRKSESVLIVTRQGDISSLESKFLRGAGDFPPIQYMYDKQKGYHVYCGTGKPKENGDNDGERLNILSVLADSVFAPPNSWGYNDAIEEIMKHTCRAVSVSKDKFKELKAHKLIIKGADGNWRRNLDRSEQ